MLVKKDKISIKETTLPKHDCFSKTKNGTVFLNMRMPLNTFRHKCKVPTNETRNTDLSWLTTENKQLSVNIT